MRSKDLEKLVLSKYETTNIEEDFGGFKRCGELVK